MASSEVCAETGLWSKWSGNMERRKIGNIMSILGLGILVSSLFNPFENIDKVFNITVNVGLWLLVLGSIIKFIPKRKRIK